MPVQRLSVVAQKPGGLTQIIRSKMNHKKFPKGLIPVADHFSAKGEATGVRYCLLWFSHWLRVSKFEGSGIIFLEFKTVQDWNKYLTMGDWF